MFGAYQAGAWKALAQSFRPDIVVGVSAGALNAWAIAGGCTPAELCDSWTRRDSADVMHLHFPWVPWNGIFDPAPLYRRVDEYYARYRPRVPFAINIVEVPRFRQIYVTGDRIGPEHLRATCAIPFGYPPVCIDGKYYVDGGLVETVPLGAAVELGATSAVVINVLKFMPSIVLRTSVGAFRALTAPKMTFPNLQVTTICPSEPLGRLRDTAHWTEENVRRWIGLGERDAANVLCVKPSR